MNRVVICDPQREGWLQLDSPREVVAAFELHEVCSALSYVEQAVEKLGLFAAGYISYEASPAFDSALSVRQPDSRLPLLWFGLFDTPCPIQLPLSGAISLPDWHPTISFQEYNAAIASIKQYISSGDTYQVNFSFRLRSPFTIDPFDFFLRLTSAQPSQYSAYIDTGDFTICSVSPELFFSLDGGNILMRPMKGTAPRGLTSDDDRLRGDALRSSEKNRAENLMIVDMVRNDLGRIADLDSVRVPSLFDVERYPTVWQMTSTATATTQASVGEIMKALFPCASVTGAPKARTMELIAELESTPRGVYTGAIGFLAPNRRAQFNVAIRTMVIDKKERQAEYGVGGGVVWASTDEGEYEECLTKARVLTEHHASVILFESILFTPPEGLFLLDEHLARLKDSAEYFGYTFQSETIEALLRTTCEQRGGQSLRLRLELNATGVPAVHANPIDDMNAGKPVRVKFAMSAVDSRNRFLYHKTTQREMYDNAMASVSGCDDAILWNERGEITESTIANVVAEIDGELVTPPVSCGLLAGTFRSLLLREGKIKERVILKKDFQKASRLFLINSVRKWRDAVLVE